MDKGLNGIRTIWYKVEGLTYRLNELPESFKLSGSFVAHLSSLNPLISKILSLNSLISKFSL